MAYADVFRTGGIDLEVTVIRGSKMSISRHDALIFYITKKSSPLLLTISHIDGTKLEVRKLTMFDAYATIVRKSISGRITGYFFGHDGKPLAGKDGLFFAGRNQSE